MVENFTIKHGLGSVTLKLRKGANGDRYYAFCRHKGKETRQSLASATTLEAARKVCKAMLQKINDESLTALIDALGPLRAKQIWATIGDIIKAALAGAAINQNKTLVTNTNCLRLVVADAQGIDRTAEGWKDKVDALSASVLDRQLVYRFFAARQAKLGQAKLNFDITDAAHGGINSTLQNARGVFSKLAMEAHFDKLKLPDLTPFLRTMSLKVPPRRPPEIEAADVQAMDAAAVALRLADPQAWELWRVMRLSGMRPFEVMAARASWLRRDEAGKWLLDIRDRAAETLPAVGGKPVIIPALRLKRGTAESTLIVSDAVMEVFQGREGYLIAPGCTDTDRGEMIERRLNSFMRQFFPREKYQKASYLLRMIASREESKLLRHVDPTKRVEERHYRAPDPVAMLEGTI